MAQDASGAGAAADRTTTLVIPGEMAARIDRLPASWVIFEIALIVQLGWTTTGATDGIAATLYPFIWLPNHAINHSQYSVLYAFQTGISILLGGYFIGWLGDKIGRRKALILSTLLAAIFIVAVRVRDQLPGADLAVPSATRSGSPGSWPSTWTYTSEMAGPVAPQQSHHVRAGVSPSSWACPICARPHPALHGPRSSTRAYLWFLGGLKPGGDAADHLAAAGVAALAGGQGTH